MLIRSASTPALKFPQFPAENGGNRFLNRPKSLTALPIQNIQKTVSVQKNQFPSFTGSPVTEEGMKGGGGSFSGGGFGGGGDWGRGGDKLETYYREMIQLFPGDCLLLANYAKYLKDVRGDLLKAEEYCGRAILMNPTGDVLSMYAELIWKNHSDGDRAKSYFEQAKKASPMDSYVLAAYARFLWDAGVDEDEEEDDGFRYPAISLFTEFSQEHSISTAS